ncbi:MAG TPA: methyltransferase domain-containing protein [Acidimicrobiales bacterium]|nr:methyltransferase domain-containing protein [Acidimicrobiales bacterium]
MDDLEEIRRFWDADAATYDNAPGHHPRHGAVLAAWASALAGMLPAPPARVLDCGAGTGFLSLLAAAAGHQVTALELAPRMLERLHATAAGRGLDIETVLGPAHDVPPGPFDAVMERHLVWTLPDPVGTLRAWRTVAPAGRLVVIESIWGTADALERLRGAGRDALRRARGIARDHHDDYPAEVRGRLPFGRGTAPGDVVAAVAEAGWKAPRLVRLRDVEWAERQAMALPERCLGVAPRFAVLAG